MIILARLLARAAVREWLVEKTDVEAASPILSSPQNRRTSDHDERPAPRETWPELIWPPDCQFGRPDYAPSQFSRISNSSDSQEFCRI